MLVKFVCNLLVHILVDEYGDVVDIIEEDDGYGEEVVTYIIETIDHYLDNVY